MTSSTTYITPYTKQFIETASLRIQKNGHPGLQPKTIQNYVSLEKTWSKFEIFSKRKFNFKDLSKNTVDLFKFWLIEDCNYSINHTGLLIGMLKTICIDAQKTTRIFTPIPFISNVLDCLKNKKLFIHFHLRKLKK